MTHPETATAAPATSRKALLAALALGLGFGASVPAFAQGIEDMDLDGNDEVSYSELLIVYPEVTTNEFLDMDTDGDDALNAEELEAAREDGIIPAE